MNHLLFAGQQIPINWPFVRRWSDGDDTLSGYTKVSVKTAQHVDPETGDTVQATFKHDPKGRSRWTKRPFPDADLRASVRAVCFHHSVTEDTKTTELVLVKRGLSVHVGIDDDGTIHQLLDLAVRDQSSSALNDIAVGVEVANIVQPYGAWKWESPPPGYQGRKIISGSIGGVSRRMFDYTVEQKEACAALVGALCAFFPHMAPATPNVTDNSKRADVLAGLRYGIVGHFHITGDAVRGKFDPGPAFDFATVLRAARLAATRARILPAFDNDPTALDRQRALQVLGFDVAADGMWGPETGKAAVRFATSVAPHAPWLGGSLPEAMAETIDPALVRALKLSLQVPS